MASVVYNSAKKNVGDGYLAWDSLTSTFRGLLVNASYTPDIDTHIYVSSITNELSGGGYVRKDIVGRTVSVDTGNDRADFNADNITWTAISGGTAAGLIIYKFVTADADSQLIAYIDFTDTVLNGGDFTLKFNNAASNGTVFRIA